MNDPLIFVGGLYLTALPSVLREWIAQNTSSEVWGVQQTGSKREEGAVWFVVSRDQNALATATHEGRSWEHLPKTAPTQVSTDFTKQRFLLDGRERFTASRVGAAKLSRLFEIAFLPRAEGLLAAATDHMQARQWQAADELLRLAEQTLTSADRERSVAYLNLDQTILLAQAHCAMQLGREGDAVVMLAAVSDDRPGDDLLRATQDAHGVPGFLLTLALAHEEAGQPASAARVYARLHQDEPEDILILSRARALRRAGLLDEAVDAYGELIDARETDEFMLASTDEADDVAAACIECAALLEQLGRPKRAATLYLGAIRRAPFETAPYQRLFALRGELDDEWSLALAGETLRLLNPVVANELDDIPCRTIVELPHDFSPITDEAHDEKVVHPRERASATLAQRWIGALTRDERDTHDIEHHAQRGDDAELVALLDSTSKLVAVEPPRIYLSHGSMGVEVLGTEDPFILLGACHLDPGDPRRLTARQLAFTLASQLEHIRADHVLLTSTEFWRTFGTKSATALLAFVPLGDLVGRLTDGSLLRWVQKLGGSSSGPIRAALEIVEDRIAKGATGESIQSAYTASLAKLRSKTLDEPDEASLMKERLADFARAAQYTADRVGLLAVDDINEAVCAMVRLSPTLVEHQTTLASEGIVGLIASAGDDPALEEFVRRVGELLKFALSDDYAELRAATL